jgi:lipoprotein signal peptidase
LWFLSLSRLRWSKARKIEGMILSLVAAAALSTALPRWHQSPLAGAYIARVGVTVLVVCLRHVAPVGAWRGTATLFAAAGLGNTLSLLWPPHEVVDFIHSAPLSKLLGWGVLYLADLYFDAGMACLLLFLGRALLSGLARLWRRGQPPAAQIPPGVPD